MTGPSHLLELVNTLDAIVWEADARSFAFSFVSQRAEVLLGYPIAQWLEEPDFWANHILPEDRERAVSFCLALTRSNQDHSFEYRFVAADGRVVWLRDIVRVFSDPRGGADRIRGLMIDITAQKQAEEALAATQLSLQQSERLFRAVVENSNDLVSVLNGDGTIRYASPSHERLLGWHPDEIEGSSAFDRVHEDDLPGLIQAFAEGIGIPGYTATNDFRYRHKDGRWRILEGRSISLLQDPAIAGAVINSRDVTDRRQTEEDLRARLEFDSFIADVTNTLANADASSLETAIDEVLASLGRRLGADRVFVSQSLHDHGATYIRHEWHVERMLPIGPSMQHVPYEAFSWFMDNLYERGCVVIRSRADLPLEAASERGWLEHWNLEATLAARLSARGRFLGFIGCCFETTPPRSLEHELPLLRSVGEVYANAMERQREEDAKTALLDVARQLSGSLDLTEMLAGVQPTIATLLGCDKVAIYLVAEPGRPARLTATYGFEGAGPPQVSRVHPGHPLFDRVRQGKVVIIDADSDPEWFTREELAATGVSCLLLAPLMVRGEVCGAAYAARRLGSRTFDSSEVELFEGMARQMSLAVHSAQTYKAKETEANVASALVRVGREVISSLDQPVLLERLAHLTAEVLDCEFSHTYLWNKAEKAYLPVAEHGESAERWEAMQVMPVPLARVQRLMERLQTEDVVALQPGEPQDVFPSSVTRGTRVKSILYVALRRGDELVGTLSAGRRRSAEPFTPDQLRIAQGIGQLASLALANTQVVEELERLSRLKSDFVATMSHELRTPLNVIMGYNDLLLDGAFGKLPPEQFEIMDRVQRSAAQLFELINTTLDVSRLDAGRLPIERVSVRLADLLAQIDAETQLRLSTGVALEWDTEDDLPPLLTDPTKVKVIVKNLIGNALKFTDRGEVRVVTRSVAGGVEIAVSDTGIGIATEAQAIIFEAFRQGDGSMTRRHGGVGLGLYIVRRLLDLLGGSITIESEPQRGSTFRVWLPADAETALDAESVLS